VVAHTKWKTEDVRRQEATKTKHSRKGRTRHAYKRYVCAQTYEVYPQNKFRLQILPLQRCGHYDAHACRVCWSFWKAQTQIADNWTTFTHCPVCLKCSRKSRSPPRVKCGL
jgi:hypothetical protein